MAILLTGGAGYIGSHTAVELCAAGCEVVGTYATVGFALSSICGESCVACGSITLAGEVAATFA